MSYPIKNSFKDNRGKQNMRKELIDAIRCHQENPTRESENRIYNLFKPFVGKIVWSAMIRFSVEHSYIQDLQSVAYIELFKIINRINLKIDPSSLIFKHMSGAVSKECSSMRVINIPRSLNLFLWKLLKIKNEKESLGIKFDLEAELEESYSPEKHKDFVRSFFESGFKKSGLIGRDFESFDSPSSEYNPDATFHESSVYGCVESTPFDLTCRNEMLDIIKNKIKSTSERKRAVLESAFFGKGGGYNITNLSKKHGMTKQRCSQIILEFKDGIGKTLKRKTK